MRYLAAILLATACVTLFGCAGGEPPRQSRLATVGEPVGALSEPNEVSVQEPAEPTAPQVEEQTPAAVESTPEMSRDAGADSGPAEIDELPVQAVNVPDSNNPAPTEPNEAAAPTCQTDVAASLYDRYAEILAAYVREDGLVDYGELRRRRLDVKAVLTQLDELDPNVYESWSSEEKRAFWINAYNLKMLEIIARNYPIESSWWLRLTWPPSDIRHIKGIWTDYKFMVMDEEFTLAEVERRFFRGGTGGFETGPNEDPRVYLALTYACHSSPPLRRQPYGGGGSPREREQVRSGTLLTGLTSLSVGSTRSIRSSSNPGRAPTETPPSQSRPDRVFSDPSDGARATDHGLDRQLDEQVRQFLARPRGLQIDRRNGVVRLSALFKPSWRGKEFIARYGTDKKFKDRDPATRAVLNFLTNYLPRQDVEFLEVENYSLEYLNFDWRLNDTNKGY